MAGKDNLESHFLNQKALKNAFIAANSSLNSRIVVIPEKSFYSMPVRLENLYNITMNLAGKWIASTNVKLW